MSGQRFATCATCGERILMARVGGDDALWKHDKREHPRDPDD